ncbi:hypothetical protein [Paenibacillus sp. UNCCL52]|nr:hypothetical protein [Paenibacillus sp. UNCCL52]
MDNRASVPSVPHVNKMDSVRLPQTDMQKNYNKVMSYKFTQEEAD